MTSEEAITELLAGNRIANPILRVDYLIWRDGRLQDEWGKDRAGTFFEELGRADWVAWSPRGSDWAWARSEMKAGRWVRRSAMAPKTAVKSPDGGDSLVLGTDGSAETQRYELTLADTEAVDWVGTTITAPPDEGRLLDI